MNRRFERNLASRWTIAAVLALGLAARPGWALPEPLQQLQETISGVAERVQACVVSIAAEREEPANLNLPVPLPPGFQFPLARGSGMVFRETDDSYYILTNAHVVRGSRDGSVRVKLVAERSERDGTVIGTPDRRTDTAVVKIARHGDEHLPTVTFGKAGDLRIGQMVLAFGSPFDFESSVTMGIVSNLDRSIVEPTEGRAPGSIPQHYEHLIQTDASINPGNSGGPLVDLQGRVVGINFAMFSPGGSAGNVGIGFAIPIERAARVIDDLIEHGRVVRGYLGVLIEDVDGIIGRDRGVGLEDLQNLLGTDNGAKVTQVTPDGPAARAGLQPGDVVVGYDGKPVHSSGELVDLVGQTAPGTEAAIEVMRDRQRTTLRLTVGELPPEVLGDRPPAAPRPARQDPLGIKIDGLTAEKARELGVDPGGVLVVGLEQAGVGARSGLLPDTVIRAGLRANEQRVAFDSVEAYQAFMDAAAETGALVALWVSLPTQNGPRQETSLLLKVPKAAEGGE